VRIYGGIFSQYRADSLILLNGGIVNTSTINMNGVSPELVQLISRLVSLVPWPYSRQAMGDVTVNLLDGKPRVAEDVFGWGRFGVNLGIDEYKTGIICLNDLSNRHRKTTEENNPELLHDIQEIMEPYSESESSLRTTLLYTNVTAQSVYDTLIANGWPEESLPTVRTISNILNRHEYKLRTVAKDKVQKKTPETDLIFENVRRENLLADNDPENLRVSTDTKTSIAVCESSRGGQSRGLVPVKASDHDMHHEVKLVPGGILEPVSGKSFLFFGNSAKTADFLADGFEKWYYEKKSDLVNIKTITINLDNGPECSGRRTQFLQRMIEFSDRTGLRIRLIYYPAYHSKYNAIERYWAGLEKSWNGYLLDSVETVLKRAGNFARRGKKAIVTFLDKEYERESNSSTQKKMLWKVVCSVHLPSHGGTSP